MLKHFAEMYAEFDDALILAIMFISLVFLRVQQPALETLFLILL